MFRNNVEIGASRRSELYVSNAVYKGQVWVLRNTLLANFESVCNGQGEARYHLTDSVSQ